MTSYFQDDDLEPWVMGESEEVDQAVSVFSPLHVPCRSGSPIQASSSLRRSRSRSPRRRTRSSSPLHQYARPRVVRQTNLPSLRRIQAQKMSDAAQLCGLTAHYVFIPNSQICFEPGPSFEWRMTLSEAIVDCDFSASGKSVIWDVNKNRYRACAGKNTVSSDGWFHSWINILKTRYSTKRKAR